MTGPVVVTGSSGFIGDHLVAALAARGDDVIAIDRRPSPRSIDGVERITAELTDDDERVVWAMRSASAVLHLAGCPGVRDTSPDIDERRRRDNVEAAEVVMDRAPLSVPVVMTSSSSVYGGARAGRPSRETDPLCPVGGYALSKAQAERACASRAERGGLVGLVRPFTVIGPGQRSDMALSRWIDQARRGEPLTVYGSLARTRDVTAVDQVVRALLTMVDVLTISDGGGPLVVNVGSGRPASLAEMVAAVHECVAATGIELVTAPVPEPTDTWADTERCREILGFVPTTDLRAVVQAMARGATPRPLVPASV